MSFRIAKNSLALGVSLVISGMSHAQLEALPVPTDALGGVPGIDGAGLDALPSLDALPTDALPVDILGMIPAGDGGEQEGDAPSPDDLPGLDALPGADALPGPEALPADVLSMIPAGNEEGEDGEGEQGGDAPSLDALPGPDALPGADALPVDVLGMIPSGGDGGAPSPDALPGPDTLPGPDALPGADALPVDVLGMIPSGGGGGAPSPDALPGADALPGPDALPAPSGGGGDAPALPGQEIVEQYIQEYQAYLDPAKVDMVAGAVQNFVNVVAADPTVLANSGSSLTPELILQMFPVLGVMQDDPAALPAYFAEGGTLVNPTIAIVPPAPLVNRSAPMPEGGGGLPLDPPSMDSGDDEEALPAPSADALPVDVAGMLPEGELPGPEALPAP